MKKVSLAGTEVSALCLGTMYFGNKESEETSFALLDQYVDAGGSFLDTSNNYAFWVEGCIGDESERLLGRWMKDRNNRNSIFLATKVGARPSYVGAPWPEGMQGISAKVILENVEQSLERLQTDYIDLYYAHIDDRSTALGKPWKLFTNSSSQARFALLGVAIRQPGALLPLSK
jgi:aryl-alcohol dehydrogenase-like predicted oxidoreductase